MLVHENGRLPRVQPARGMRRRTSSYIEARWRPPLLLKEAATQLDFAFNTP